MLDGIVEILEGAEEMVIDVALDVAFDMVDSNDNGEIEVSEVEDMIDELELDDDEAADVIDGFEWMDEDENDAVDWDEWYGAIMWAIE